MTSVQQRLFHPHDTQWPMSNEVWVCWWGLCFAGGMFLFQQFARTAKTGSGLLCGKWRNLCHIVALSHSYHWNNSLQSEVGNTPFTGLVVIYNHSEIRPQRKPPLISSVTRTRHFPSLHCKCINSESHAQEKLHWNEHTCKLKEERPSAGILSCKISLQEKKTTL